MNITDAISSKKGFRAKVNLYTDDKFENIEGVRKLSKRESDEDEYDPWTSISPIGNGSYRGNHSCITLGYILFTTDVILEQCILHAISIFSQKKIKRRAI